MGFLPTECRESLRFRTAPECLPQQRQALFIQQAEVRFLRIGTPIRLHFLLCQQPFPNQFVQIQQIVVAGKCRCRLIGRVTEARGRNGQNLPIALVGGLQKINEVPGLTAQTADAVR